MKPSVHDIISMRLVVASIANRIAANPTQTPAVAKKKKLFVIDFDDTLVSSEGSMKVTHADGQQDILDSHDYALYKTADKDKLDFTDFNDVKKPRKIKKGFDAITAAVKDPNTRVVILTARPKGAASAVKKYMAEQGFPDIETVALQSGEPMDKSKWISDAIEKHGHTDVSFRDDSLKNAAAVKSIAEKHSGVSFDVQNPALPKEDDYDGPSSDKQYTSDNPTKAVSVIDKSKGVQPVPGQHSSAPAKSPQKTPTQPGQEPAKSPDVSAEEKAKSDMGWWKIQSPEFKERYLQKHPGSRFKGASIGFRGALSMPTESNQALKDFIFANWKKTHNRKVEKYLTEDFWEKLDSMGDFSGHWMEQLESGYEKMANPPRGLLAHFTEQDFNDLFFSLFGYQRRKH